MRPIPVSMPLMVTLSLFSVSCSSRWLGGRGEPDAVLASLDAPEAEPEPVQHLPEATAPAPAAKLKRSGVQELALKQAQMWARLDKLEAQVVQQREKIKLLEQGLLLGIPPDELMKSAPAKPVKPAKPDHHSQAPAVHMQSAAAALVEQASPSAPSVLGEPALPDNRDAIAEHYKKRLAFARDLFQKGRYSNAYLEFSKMERDFEAKLSLGEPQFWIGRCWLQMKEFQNAKQYLANFIAAYPSSPWQASAKLYLAQTEMSLGLRENAVAHLQNLIREHPYEGSAEAAKQLLQNMNQTL